MAPNRITRALTAGISTACVAVALVTAGAATPADPVHAQTAPACTADPGLAVLWDWSHGTMPPFALPGADWQLSEHPTNILLNFLVPPGWTTTVLDPPAWFPPPPAASWSGVRVVAPGNAAAVEVGSGALSGAYDSAQAAWFGVSGIFGVRPPNVLCAGDGTGGASVVAVELDGLVAYVSATAFPAAGTTAFVYYTAVAPSATFAVTTAGVFVPLFYQFYLGGGDPDVPPAT